MSHFETFIAKILKYKQNGGAKIWTLSFKFNTDDDIDVDVVDIIVKNGQVCLPDVLHNNKLTNCVNNDIPFLLERLPEPRKQYDYNQLIIEQISENEWTLSFIHRGHFLTRTVHSFAINLHTKHSHVVEYNSELIFSTVRGTGEGNNRRVIVKKKMPFVFNVHEALLLRMFLDKCKLYQRMPSPLKLTLKFDEKNDNAEVIVFDKYIFACSPNIKNEKMFEKEICAWILKHLPSMIVNFSGPEVNIDFDKVIVRANATEVSIEFQ